MADSNVIDINTPGWEGVNAEAPTPPVEPERQRNEIDAALNRILESNDGKTVLNWLVGSYLHQPTWAPGYDKDFGYFREGQNTILREIVLRADRAREEHDGR